MLQIERQRQKGTVETESKWEKMKSEMAWVENGMKRVRSSKKMK